jgi:large-conductance mechanosensitive channel
MDDTPRQFLDELKFAIARRRIGQIALAVVLAEECIRYLNTLVWYMIIPAVANVLQTHTESVLFQTRSRFNWELLAGATIEFFTAIIFVFYVNRLVHGRNKPRSREQHHSDPDESATLATATRDEEYDPIVPRLLSAPESHNREFSSAAGERDLHPRDAN